MKLRRTIIAALVCIPEGALTVLGNRLNASMFAHNATSVKHEHDSGRRPVPERG